MYEGFKGLDVRDPSGCIRLEVQAGCVRARIAEQLRKCWCETEGPLRKLKSAVPQDWVIFSYII